MKFTQKKSTKKAVRRVKPSRSMGVKTVKSIVKRAIARTIEDKQINLINSTGHIVYPAVASAINPQIIPISPMASFLSITQGIEQGRRIGNQITIKKAMLRGTLYPTAYDAIFNSQPQPVRVIFWLLYDRENDNSVPTIDTTFLQAGNSTNGLQNSLSDLWQPVNDDRWRVMTKRTYKLGNSAGEGTGSLPNFNYFANNDFKFNVDFSIDYTKYLVKTVKFNDNTANPSTRGLFWVATYVAANGSAIASQDIKVRMDYSLDMTYEDA